MRGLILAGGFATRLRPLSCSKPKLLFPVVGVPLIDRMVYWFSEARVSQLILAVNHLSDRLRAEVGDRRHGSGITFSVEEKPLGTAGPIRLAKNALGKDETFIVANGDIASNIDLKSVVRAHQESEAEATVCLVSVKDQRAYGSTTLDSKGRIVGFEEKSETRHGPGWINAGVYVLNPSVIKMIPPNRRVSLEHDLFPSLAKSMKMQGWKHSGFWYDLGNLPGFVAANRELLKRLEPLALTRQIETTPAKVRPPSHVGRGSIIEDGARVGPYGILSEKVKVQKGGLVRNSIVFEETTIGRDCTVDGSIIGERVTVGAQTRIGKGSVVAGEIRIPDGTVIGPSSVVLN